MSRNANASVKFFLDAKKVLVTVVAKKRKGNPRVKSAVVYVHDKGRRVDLSELKPKRFSLKDRGPDGEYIGYLLVIPFYEEDGTKDPDADGIRAEVPTARVRVTITNQPPAADPPDVEIDETEQNPQDEPGEDPTGPFAFLDEE